MALVSRQKDRVFISVQESTSYTAETTAAVELLSATMSFPEADYMRESDKDKIGTGQMGKGSDLQALVSPFSITCQRLSEVATLMTYCFGTLDTVTTPVGGTNARVHEMLPLVVATRTMPTFTIEYGTGTGNAVISGCVINDFSLGLSVDGNGVIEATFNGFGNKHFSNSGTLALNPTGSMSSAANDFTPEPLINMKATKVWVADSFGDVEAQSVSFQGPDLPATLVDLSKLVNSMTLTMTNNMVANLAVRGGGGGVACTAVRGNPEVTFEMNLRKDAAVIDIDALNLADTSKSVEIQFGGPEIEAGYNYGLDIFLPKVQFMQAPEDDESPISKAATLEVYEDSNNEYMRVYSQVQLTTAYIAT